MIKVGSRVRYIGGVEHVDSKFYPPIGTLGTVKIVDTFNCEVKWDEGTIGDGIWWCEREEVEEVFNVKFNINDYKGKYVMHCKTEEEAKEFHDYMSSIGKHLQFSLGCSYGNNVIFFNERTWCGKQYAVNKGYTILEWSDFMSKEFTKANLKTGDVVMQRNGVIQIANCELDMFITSDWWNDMSRFHSDLTHRFAEDYDIVAVRRPNNKGECNFKAFAYNYGTLVYERKEVEEMTLAEVCKLLGKEIKIIK